MRIEKFAVALLGLSFFASAVLAQTAEDVTLGQLETKSSSKTNIRLVGKKGNPKGVTHLAVSHGNYKPDIGWRSDRTRSNPRATATIDIQNPSVSNTLPSLTTQDFYVRSDFDLVRALRWQGNKRIRLAPGTYNLRTVSKSFPINETTGSLILVGESHESTKIIGPGTKASQDFLQLGKGYGQVVIDRIEFENWGTVVRLLKNDHDQISVTNCSFRKIANTVGTYNSNLAHGGIDTLVFRNNQVLSSRAFGVNLVYQPNSRLRNIDISRNVFQNVISKKFEAIGIGLRANLKPGVEGFTTADSKLNISQNTVRNVRKRVSARGGIVDGIIVDGFINVSIRNNIVSEVHREGGDSRGIYVALVKNCVVHDNTMTNCGWTGFLCKRGWDMVVSRNVIRGSQTSSFMILRGNRITITSNEIKDGGNRAMYIASVNGLFINNNVIANNGVNGIPPAQRGSVFLFANQDVTFEQNHLQETIGMAPIRIAGNLPMKNYSIRNNLIHNPNFNVAVEFGFKSSSGTGALDNLLIAENQTANINGIARVASGKPPTSSLIRNNQPNQSRTR